MEADKSTANGQNNKNNLPEVDNEEYKEIDALEQ